MRQFEFGAGASFGNYFWELYGILDRGGISCYDHLRFKEHKESDYGRPWEVPQNRNQPSRTV